MSRERTEKTMQATGKPAEPIVPAMASPLTPPKHWLKEPKVTEWITALTAPIGLLAVFWSGLLDAKKIEVSAQKSELSAQNQYLMIDKLNLERRKENLTEEVRLKNEELARMQSRLVPLEREREARAKIMQLRKSSVVEVDNERVYFEISLSLDEDGTGWNLYITNYKHGQNFQRVSAGFQKPVYYPHLSDLLRESSNIKKLKEVIIVDTVVNSDSMSIFPLMPELHHLNLEHCDVDDNELAAMARLPESLKYLRLGRNQLHRAPNFLTRNLEWLSLSYNPILDDGISSINAATNLKTLELDFTGISNKSIENILSLNRLEDLRLISTRIDEEGVVKLADLPSLRTVGVDYNILMPKTREILAKRRPDLMIGLPRPAPPTP